METNEMMQSKAEVTLLYGASGTTKTSQIGQLAEYIWDKHQLKTRLVTSDGGGFDVIRDYVDAGIVEVFVVGATTDHPLEAWEKLTTGFWPAVEGQPTREWKCSVEGVGAYAFEGLTSLGDLMISYLRRDGKRLSQDPNYALKDGDTQFYGSNMTYFGFAQDRVDDYVMKSDMLPVRKVLWTALEAKGEEDGTKLPTFGPDIAGKKSISRASQWFGDCIHLEMYVQQQSQKDKNDQMKVVTRPVMYLKPHADPVTKIPFPAKLRIPPALLPEFDQQVPDGFLDPPSLRRVFELQDALRAKGLERLRAKVQPPTGTAVAVNQK
jgi:hypothetical protein